MVKKFNAEYEAHKSHCFMIVQPDNEFMGCKYGDDEDCPMKKNYPLTRDTLLATNETLMQYLKYCKAEGKDSTFNGLLDFIDKNVRRIEEEYTGIKQKKGV